MLDYGISSQAVIDLFSKPTRGIFYVLDEETIMPRNSDKIFTQKLQNNNRNNPKFSKSTEGSFQITHYAGTVEYNTSMWLEINKDYYEDDIVLTVMKSEITTLSKLFVQYGLNGIPSYLSDKGKPDSRSLGCQFVTVCRSFRDQFYHVLSTLKDTHPHFIRCIIPNHKQEPLKIDDAIVLDQLRCNSIFESTKIYQLGYPNSLKYTTFLRRYYLLAEHVSRSAPYACAATKSILETLIKDGVVDATKCQYGLTKIFFRVGELPKIEEARERKIVQLIIVIKACARGYIARKYLKCISCIKSL